MTLERTVTNTAGTQYTVAVYKKFPSVRPLLSPLDTFAVQHTAKAVVAAHFLLVNTY